MPTYVALLRGINVGGRNSVPMTELRQVAASLGHAEVATYIQSGNLVFSSAANDAARLGADLERAIAARFGLQVPVVVVSADELAQVVRANPYGDEANPKAVHAVFFAEPLGAEALEALADAQRQVAARGSRDQLHTIGRVVYLHAPDGFGRSDLAARLGRFPGTARNWATVNRLLALARA